MLHKYFNHLEDYQKMIGRLQRFCEKNYRLIFYFINRCFVCNPLNYLSTIFRLQIYTKFDYFHVLWRTIAVPIVLEIIQKSKKQNSASGPNKNQDQKGVFSSWQNWQEDNHNIYLIFATLENTEAHYSIGLRLL